ncbi:MAG: AAA family ATPase, partial [Leptospirales bacterium]
MSAIHVDKKIRSADSQVLEPQPAVAEGPAAATPFYRVVGREVEVFEAVAARGLALLLKGPTGSGKSRFVEYMAARLNRELITVACHDETSAVDLLGRHLIEGGDTVWRDGPLTRAVREGAILYLDEIAEARPDVIVAIHSLTDHRRSLYLDRVGETLRAPPEFLLVASFNPGYQRGIKELKPSTRQRFV